MANQVKWFEIIGGDAALLHNFYSQLFGWNINGDNEMQYGLVSEADAGVGGGIGPDPSGGSKYVTIYVGVDRINATLAEAERLGGKTVMEPTEIPDFGITFALLSDPEGHVIGLMQN